MMGTEIFLFGPKGAEKMEIKDFNLCSEIMRRTSFNVKIISQKISPFYAKQRRRSRKAFLFSGKTEHG